MNEEGKRLFKSKMALHGLTQLDIAKELGVERSTISNKLRGRQGWSKLQINKVSEILGLSERETRTIFLCEEWCEMHHKKGAK